MNKKKDNYFILFSNCIPVKGITRSAICDLHSNKIKLIPNDLYDILTNYQTKSIRLIKKIFKNQFNSIIDEYFDFLFKNDFGFYSSNFSCFPKLSSNWISNLKITNAILDRDNCSKYEIKKVIEELDLLGCKHLQVRFYDKTDITYLEEICGHLKKIESSIISLELVVPYDNVTTESELSTILNQYERLTNIIVHSSLKNKNILNENNSLKNILFTKEALSSHLSCGKINPSYFAVNIKNYTEALNQNSCLNKKISMDIEGNIKNCPSMTQIFGNIKDTSLKEALEHSEFKKYWKITKDAIDVCKDCEFRYVCTDCRAYVENPENEYSKPLKCGYNPYTNEWQEWSTNPLKQKAKKYYGMRELIN